MYIRNWLHIRSGGLVLAATFLIGSTSPSSAGGFYAPYQSGTALGTALAGASARNDDASFFFYNPANIADFDEPSVFVGAQAFVPSITMDASRAISPDTVTDLTGAGGSGEMTDPAGAPSFAAAIPLGSGLTLGLSGSAPFVVDIEANPGWAGRFHLLSSQMTGTNLTTALSYRLASWISVSAGFQAQHFKVAGEKSELIPLGPLPVPPVEARGYLKGEGWGYGGVAGIVLTPVEGSRVGISYRSHMTHTLKGSAGAYLPGIPVLSAKFDVVTPEVVSLGLEQALGPDLRLFAEGQWVKWSRFKGFDIALGSGQRDIRAQDWDDTWLAAVGLGYRTSADTELTAGIQVDTAVSSGGNTLSPDSNRIMIGVGLSHKVASGTLTAHYAHMFFDDGKIAVDDVRTGILDGTFKGSLDVFGVGFKLDW